MDLFQVNPKNLTRCLIIKPKMVGIPFVAIVATGTGKLKSMFPQARAIAFNTGHLEQLTENKTSTDNEASSRTKKLPDSMPEEKKTAEEDAWESPEVRE